MLVKSFSVVFAMIAAFLVSIGANSSAKSKKVKTTLLIALSGIIDLRVCESFSVNIENKGLL